MKLGIVGSRRRNSFEDKALIKKRILKLKPDLLVSGGCLKGADRFAEELAEELNIPITIFRPEVPRGSVPYFKVVEGYYARNEKIAKAADHLIALVAPDRKGGTENAIKHFVNKHEKDLMALNKKLEIL